MEVTGDATEVAREPKESHRAPKEDVTQLFTSAAVKAAERKDAARCQAEPAGEAA